MNRPWELPEQPDLGMEVPGWPAEDVLIEYEGPQLAVLCRGAQHYLALATDEDGGATRWLVTPTSKMEVEALRRGGISVRAALAKPTLLVVDYAHDDQRPLHVWEVSSQSLPDAVWPEPGALLPESVRSRYQIAEQAEPSFDLDASDRVSFGALSSFTHAIQDVWNAIAARYDYGLATLSAKGLSPGSLRLNLDIEDADKFASIANHYRKLIVASDDTVSLDTLLKEEPPRVASAFRAYLKAIATQRVDVLATWTNQSAFIGHGTAATYESASAEALAHVDVWTETVRPRGFFQGFWPGRRGKYQFEFRDIESGQVLAGRIDRSFGEGSSGSVTVGDEKRYRATIVIEHRGDESTVTLTDCEPLRSHE